MTAWTVPHTTSLLWASAPPPALVHTHIQGPPFLPAGETRPASSVPACGWDITDSQAPCELVVEPMHTLLLQTYTDTHRLPKSLSSGKAILAMPGVHSPIWVKSRNKCVCSPQPPAGHSLFIEALCCDGSLQLVPVPQVCICGNKHVQTRTNTKALRHTETKSKFLLELAVGGQG